MRTRFNKVLSVDYRIVNYTDIVVEQLSRMFLSFLTKQLSHWASPSSFPYSESLVMAYNITFSNDPLFNITHF